MSDAISRDKAAEVTAEIKAAVQAIAAKHSMEIVKTQNSYGEVFKVTLNLTPVVLDANGINLMSDEARAYDKFASSYGLRPGLLGTKFVVKGKEYKFTGLMPSRSKYPISSVDNKGGVMLWTKAAVATILAAADAKELV